MGILKKERNLAGITLLFVLLLFATQCLAPSWCGFVFGVGLAAMVSYIAYGHYHFWKATRHSEPPTP